MPTIRVNRLLPAVVAALALLFAVLEPPASRGLPFLAALAFWLLHIGLGMLLAVRATEWISRSRAVSAWNPWLRLLAGGVAGSLLFAPAALAIDALLPVTTPGEPADDLLDQWEAAGGALALVSEWLQLSPSYLASWLLVNAAPLAAGPVIERLPADVRAKETATGATAAPSPWEPLHAPDPGGAPLPDAVPAVRPPEDSAPAESRAPALPDAHGAFLALLPPAIGTDLVAIQADLHYLQVRTTRGRATVLASIATAEAALCDHGLRVHRSHWIALAHVVRVARTARGTFLTMSDGSRVPVSRRRAGEVQARLGRSFVVDPS